MTKLNLIFVLADQLGLHHLGYTGNRKALTPNIDRFADKSVDFRQCVSSMPVCSAFRASLMTGKHTTSTGMVINELRLNPNQRCLGHILTEGGYRTPYIGKWHLYANELGNHFDPKNSFIPPGPHRLGFGDYWAAYNFHHDYYGDRAYYHADSAEKVHFGEGVFEPDGQTDLAIDWIEQNGNSADPFALFLSWGTPHDPWTPENVPQEWFQRFLATPFPPPGSYTNAMDPYGDAWSNIPKNPRQIEKWMRVYYAMTANLDWNFGRLLDALERLNLNENTIVVFTSDHGEMFGAHGRMKKNIFYEEAARIPFLVRHPAQISGSAVSNAPMSSVDIMPTLLGMLSLPIPEDVEGYNLSHVVLGKEGVEPEFAFMQNTGACAAWEDGHEWRALRTPQYTYAVYREARKELLFDNLADSTQMVDLSTDPRHQTTLAAFRNLLTQKMTELNDTFPPSSYYRANWVNSNRCIIRSATTDWTLHTIP